MLILTRNINKTVNLEVENTNICIDVTVLGIRGSQVSLGFNAPQNVKINRAEIISERTKNGQQLTPEQQARDALKRIRNG